MDTQSRFRDVGLVPFDPQKHTPQDVGLGGLSTEYLSTAPMGEDWVNYPTIWWDKNGNPVLVPDNLAQMMTGDYMSRTGLRAPTYPNEGSAIFGAMNRSAMGGATNDRLFK